MKSLWFLLAIVGVLALAACGDTTVPEPVVVSDSAGTTDLEATVTVSVQATVAAQPTSTFTPMPTKTPVPIATYTPVPTSSPVPTLTYEEYFELGIENFANAEIEDAITNLSKAIELNPDYTDAYFLRGLIYTLEEDYDKGIADFEKVVELAPEHTDAKVARVEAYSARGADYALKDDFDKSIADFERAIELEPDSADAKIGVAGVYFMRGIRHFEEGDYDRAFADFDKAIADFEGVIELDSNNAEANFLLTKAYLLRGVAYYEEGYFDETLADFDRAFADFEKVIELDPNNVDAKYAIADAYLLRGIFYSEKGDNDRAIEDFERALEIDTDDADIEDIRREAQNEIAKIELEQSEGIDWSPCETLLKCGFVEVPADYRNPDAGSIKIAVNVRRADYQDERIGYLFVNPGGPGESGLELVDDSDFIFTYEILDRFDIIGFDPRGVGESEPEFACGVPGERLALLATIDGDIDTPEEIATGEAAANLCIESMGPVGALLHSEYVARDMDEIRKALGAEQISYLGFSYGSELGIWYATLFPESVRAMVVDGADNPVDNADTQQERMEEYLEEWVPFEEQLEQALMACDSADCPIYNDGDPIGYYHRAAEKLHLVNDAAGGVPYAAFLGVVTFLYDEARWPDLWQGLHELNEEDDPTILLDFVMRQLGDEPTAASFTAHVNCLDGFALEPELDRATRLDDSAVFDAIDEEKLPLIEAADSDFPSACPFYDQFAPEPLDIPLDGGGAPILVIGNHDDPATSFGESEELVTEVLSNGYLLETSHASHVIYPDNECANEYAHAVLIDLELPDERRVFCERED